MYTGRERRRRLSDELHDFELFFKYKNISIYIHIWSYKGEEEIAHLIPNDKAI